MKTGFKAVGAGLIAVLANAITHAANAAPAQDNWYFGASGDMTWLRNSDTGGGGNIDLGYRLWPSNYGDFRLEGEAGYHGAKGDNGFSGTHYFTYMGNLNYDFTGMFPASGSGWHMTPYIGGGIGDAELHYGNNQSFSNNFTGTFHNHDNEFAYQGLAGLSFTSASMPTTEWSIGYRYLGTDNENIRSNSVEIGARFYF